MKVFTFVFTTLLLAASSLVAQQQPTPEELKARIEALEQKLAEVQRSSNGDPAVEELRRQIEILSREIEALKVGVSAAPTLEGGEVARTRYGLSAAASKVYRAEHGITFGGYGEMLYENYAADRDTGLPSGATDQLDFLRAILYTGYKFSDRMVFNSELEFEHAQAGEGKRGEVSVEFAYLDFLIRPEFNVRAGMVLVPVGLVNELHEPTAFLGAKRPQIEGSIIPTTWRENGAGIYGEAGAFSYRAYIVSALESQGFNAGGLRSGRSSGAKAQAEDFAFVGRLDWQPVEGLLFGGSVYNGDTAQGRRTPAGESFDANLMMTELHGEARFRGLSLRALWTDVSIDDVAQLNAANKLTGSNSIGEELNGWYAEAGYDLTNFLPGNFSVIPFVRYEDFNTQGDVPAGFEAKRGNDVNILTTGVSFKPYPQAVIKVDYMNYDRADDSGVDQFNVALGYIF